MPESWKYEKIPRPESIAFFQEKLQLHRGVRSVKQIESQIFLITKSNRKKITVFLTNIYIVWKADLYEILSAHAQINCIVTISAWNGYTNEAKEDSIRNNTGLFTFAEFLGALNYDEEKFINYSPPERG